MKMISAVLSDAGKVRKNNEDSCLLNEDHQLILVADGMGGHAAGEVASQMAVQLINDQVKQAFLTGKIPALPTAPAHWSDHGRLLAAAVGFANEAIHAASLKSPERAGMGTTVVAALLNGKRLSVAHVGDSRLYLWRRGMLRQITTDHSLVAEQVAKGLMTTEQAEASEIKNVLTRALGVSPSVEVDVTEPPVTAGDIVLVCSDGLSRMVPDAQIRDAVSALKKPTEMCQNLVALALEHGGRDNVTVAVGAVQSGGVWERILSLWRKD